MKAAYLGPVGSYSERAVQILGAHGIPCRDFADVFDAAARGETDFAVIPVENSIEGYVNTNLDLMLSGNLSAVGEIDLKIDNRVFSLPNTANVTQILSHAQALNQCRANLRRLYPNAVMTACNSTADALTKLDAHTVAVAGAHNAREGIVMSGPVSDADGNVTRFWVLSKNPAPLGTPDKISMAFEAVNAPGGLVRLLEVLEKADLNMTAIVSRPHKTELGRYFFFIDVAGNLTDARTNAAIEELRRSAPDFRLLGNYETAKTKA